MEVPKDKFAGKSALVIDDELMMRRLVGQLLAEIGFKTIVYAEDGAEGLKTLENNDAIDIVICDLEMPLIGGLEFLNMLRSSSYIRDPNMPVVVVTGHSEEQNVHKAVKIGVHGFLVKPISRKNLESRVFHALHYGKMDPDQLQHNNPPENSYAAPVILDFNKK